MLAVIRREDGRLQWRKLSKAESIIENMADGEGKFTAQKEIAQAQDAMLGGKMGACAMHLTKAMHVGTAK